jgi:acetolactate synthase small subunit
MPTATFTVQVRPRSDVLHRVVSVCHRRALVIVALSYAGDAITLTVRGETGRSSHLRRWLGSLHDVVAVHELEPSFDRG